MSDKPLPSEIEDVVFDEESIEALPAVPSRLVVMPLERAGQARFPVDFPDGFDGLLDEEA